jgi:hypothetical protein
MNSDDDIRRLLAEDDAQPDAAVDDRIHAAARDAASEAAPPPTVRSSRFRWASGIGAAAALLLAVLVVQRSPEEAMVLNAPADSAEQAAPAGSAPKASAQPPSAPARFLERRAIADAEADLAVTSAGERTCEPHLRFDDLSVCIDAGKAEVRQSPPQACREPLVLEMETGPATAIRTDQWLVISSGAAEHWLVRCEPEGWAWYKSPSQDKGTPR